MAGRRFINFPVSSEHMGGKEAGPQKTGPGFQSRKRAEYCFESTVSERELTELRGRLGEFCEKLGELTFAHRNSLTSLLLNSARAKQLTE